MRKLCDAMTGFFLISFLTIIKYCSQLLNQSGDSSKKNVLLNNNSLCTSNFCISQQLALHVVLCFYRANDLPGVYTVLQIVYEKQKQLDMMVQRGRHYQNIFLSNNLSLYLSRLSLSGFACLSSGSLYTIGTPGTVGDSANMTLSPEQKKN